MRPKKSGINMEDGGVGKTRQSHQVEVGEGEESSRYGEGSTAYGGKGQRMGDE